MDKRWILIAVASAVCGVSFAQEKKFDEHLVGTWDAIIENVSEVVHLKIANVTPKSNGEFTVEASYGWPSRERPVKSIDLSQSGKEIRLSFESRSGGKANTTLGADGTFVGTWDFRSSPTRAIKIVKLKSNEIRSTPLVERASPDVPKECAAFLGGWTGTWNRSGQAWLWVTNVDAKCNAQYAYVSFPYPRIFATTQIRDGVLEAPVSVGKNSFRFVDGKLVDQFSGNGTYDSLTFNPIDQGTDPAKSITVVVSPGPDVPASCAAFSGRWSGTWGYGIGQQWLWVASIDANCSARVAYLANSDVPSAFQTLEIKDGKLSLVCGGRDTCTFSAKGDELNAAAYGNSGANNTAVFKKLPH